LETLVRRRSAQHWMVQRAQIVLLSADGLEVHDIGARLDRAQRRRLHDEITRQDLDLDEIERIAREIKGPPPTSPSEDEE